MLKTFLAVLLAILWSSTATYYADQRYDEVVAACPNDKIEDSRFKVRVVWHFLLPFGMLVDRYADPSPVDCKLFIAKQPKGPVDQMTKGPRDL